MFLREIRMISVIEGVIEGLIHPIAEKNSFFILPILFLFICDFESSLPAGGF